MNANLAVAAPESMVVGLSERLQRSGVGTRAGFLVSSALTGALLSLLVAWPGTRPSTPVAPRANSPVAAAPPPPAAPQVLRSRAEPSSVMAGSAVVEAFRAVGAASETSLRAQALQIAATSPSSVAAEPGAAAGRLAEGPAAAGAQTQPATAVTAGGTSVVNSTSAPVPLVADVGAAIIGPRQPATVQGQGPNRIAVPGSPLPPAVAAAALLAAPTSVAGTNRISVPAAPPPP